MYPSLYLQYDAGFTVLSLVASITAMTLAFFIMGTDMHDWFTLPGKRRRRDEKRKKNGGDEYGRWKKTHKGGRNKGSESGMGLGIGALLETAGKVAKWSLVDTGENRWSSIGKKGDKMDEGNEITVLICPICHLRSLTQTIDVDRYPPTKLCLPKATCSHRHSTIRFGTSRTIPRLDYSKTILGHRSILVSNPTSVEPLCLP
jgi:hypothetical protein